MKAALLLATLCLAAAPARAAGPLDGRPTAAAEADLRSPGAELVEIEGFVAPDGDIPCRGKSFANAWHYKFYQPGSGEWLIVNACGDSFINAAKHFPYMKADEPDKKLPHAIAAPAAVLKKLKDEGLFTPEPNPFSRDIQLKARMLPEKQGRPAGCYWTVSQGKARALTDCAAGQAWKITAAAGKAKAAAGSLQPAVKGKDTAGRYASLAVDYMGKKVPGSRLVMVETLADRTGSAKCIDPKDGWSFIFASRTAGISVFGGCRGKTSVEMTDFDNKHAVDLNALDTIILPFRDSDAALAQVPKDCVGAHPTVSMKLANYKAGHSPAAGRSQLWTVNCGSKKFYVDANTGQPVPVDVKTEK